jgi:hypothetical protein
MVPTELSPWYCSGRVRTRIGKDVVIGDLPDVNYARLEERTLRYAAGQASKWSGSAD